MPDKSDTTCTTLFLSLSNRHCPDRINFLALFMVISIWLINTSIHHESIFKGVRLATFNILQSNYLSRTTIIPSLNPLQEDSTYCLLENSSTCSYLLSLQLCPSTRPSGSAGFLVTEGGREVLELPLSGMLLSASFSTCFLLESITKKREKSESQY